MGLLSKAYKRVLKRINEDSDTSTGANIFKRGTSDLSSEETINMERDFHNEESSTYWLPKDPAEQQRLTGQHFAIKELYQGNVLENVRKKLDFKKGIRVLDVGCGSGAWIMDMATEYPNCVYEGCDIVEVANKRVSLQQVTFRYGNVLDRLPFEDNSFDFVHMRLFVLALQVNQWPIAINEILRVTKPGGMVQLVEFDLKMTGNETVQQVLTGIHSACEARGQDPRIALQLGKLVSENKQATSVQSDYRSVDMASNTKTAKMFVWDWIETIKSMLPVISSKMGLETEEERKTYLDKLKYDLTHSNSYTYMNAVTAEKINKIQD
ncbi:hypothetical protein RMATCC62417_03226 [Rhizopus microsporus]|nr:hypothetical protein RMATCC62417_03226 [Rhizopus microsporus]